MSDLRDAALAPAAAWRDVAGPAHVDFRAVFDAIPSPYMVLDRELRYVAANPAYQGVTMRSLDELLGGKIFDLFPNEGESGWRLRQSFQRVLETGAADTIAYLPYAIPRPDERGGGLEQRYWTAVHTPLLDERGEVAFIVQNTVDVTEIARLRRATSLPFRMVHGESDLLQRAREAERAKEQLLDEADDFRRLFQQAPGMIAVLSGPEHVYTFVNDACRRFVGGRDIIGLRVREAFPETDGQALFDLLDQVYRTGSPRSGEAIRVVMPEQAPAEPLQEAFIDFSFAPIFGPDGEVTGIFAQGTDRTDGVRAQERQQLLLDELNHRVKNTLATVQSIATQTLRGQADPEAARAVFVARIVALSQAHNLLSRSNWAGAELRDLLVQELTPYGPERFRLSGPVVRVPPRAALALGMVFHELATNAAKHGALTSERGRVEVGWGLRDAEGCRWLSLSWRERDGPGVAPPGRPGFGTRLIRMSLEGELGGSTDLRFEPEGLTLAVSIPLPPGWR
ncbi:MAG TPA: HWE histidine kinase domain-containing protein [Geminicoccaceae bacterium]